MVESYDGCRLEENEIEARVGQDWIFDYRELFKPLHVFPEVSIDSKGLSCSIDEEDDVTIGVDKPLVLGIDSLGMYDEEPSSSAQV